MKTHQILFSTLGGSLLVLSCSSATNKNNSEEQRLNIIYIMSDDHTRQAISAYNDLFGTTTPNIDKLASEGIIFENSYVANSISGPSRACMLTGKHSHKNGFIDNHTSFDGSQQTAPKLLQEAGYQTAMIGKWHLETTPTGFDHWDILPGQGDYYSPVMYTQNDTTTYPNIYVTDLITNKSIEWLENRDKTKPFCLFVHHKAVHRNFMCNIPDLYAFEKEIFPYPDNLFDDYSNREAAATQEMSIEKYLDLTYDLKIRNITDSITPKNQMFDRKEADGQRLGTYGRMNAEERKAWDAFYDSIGSDFSARKLKGKELVKWKYQRYVKDYLKTAKALDDNIGRLMAYLKANNMLENTIVIYTSDQGFYMGEHGWFDKRFMYEESFSTPHIVRMPSKYKAQDRVDALIQNIDHTPTFLEIAGVKIPDDIQGKSYLPFLKGEKPKNWRNSLYYHYYEYPGEHAVKRHYGIRTQRYKLIHFYNDIDSWELYDLQKDPSEMQNLINNPAYMDTIELLKKDLETLQTQYDDPIRHTKNRNRLK